MLKELKQKLNELMESKEFREFKKNAPKSYLVSCFWFIDAKTGKKELKIDFYNPEKHKISSFEKKEKIECRIDQEIFQEKKEILNELKLEKIKVDFEGAIKKAKDILLKKYNEEASKLIVILQNIKGVGVWNITAITSGFKLLNLKLNAENNEIISEHLESVFEFKKLDT